MYQYFVKVVPTTYVNVEGAVLFTSQYSVTKHQKVSSTPQLVFWPNVLMFCLFVISIYQHFNYLSGTFVWEHTESQGAARATRTEGPNEERIQSNALL